MKSSELAFQRDALGSATGPGAAALDIALSRRQLLALAGATVAGMAAAEPLTPTTGRAASADAAPAKPASGGLTAETFFALVGETFAFEALDGAAAGMRGSMTLADVSAPELLGERPDRLRPQPFSLLFTLADGTLGNSGIASLEHAALGRVDVFLQQVLTGDPPRYEAVFN